MKKGLIGLIGLIGLVGLVMAADFTPQGDINLRGVYNVYNTTNISFLDGTVLTSAEALLGNLSFNQSYTDTLYAGIDLVNYYLKTEVDANIEGNLSTARTDIESNFTLLDETKLNISDYQSAFNTNVSGAELLSSTELNKTYANLSRTINEANISDLSHTSAGNESWNQSLYESLFQGDFDLNLSVLGLISSTIGNNTYRNLSGLINEANISDLTHVSPGNLSWNEIRYGLIFQGSFDNNITILEFLSSTQLNYTYRKLSDTINEANISDLTHIENETVRFQNLTTYECQGTTKMIGVHLNGTVECGSVAGGGDYSFTDYQLSFNENSTDAEFLSSTEINNSYRKLSDTINKGNLTNTGTLLFDWVDSEIANAISIIGGILGANSVSGLWTTTATWTLGDGDDRIDINSDTWNVANGVMSGVATLDTGQGANELYDMDQNVLEASNVIFVDITSSGNITITTNGENLTIGDTETNYNGTCLNTYVQGTLVQSIGCA